MKGNKMSAILAILIMLSGVLAVVPIARADDPRGAHPVTACAPSVMSYTNSSGTYNFPAPGYPTPSPTTNIHFLWGTNGSASSTFYADVYAFNVSALDSMMGWSIGFFYNPTIVWVHSITNGSVLNPYPSANFTYIAGSFTNTGSGAGTCKVYTWSLYSTATPPTISAPNAYVDLMHIQFQINPSLTTAQVAAIAGTPQLFMGFTLVPKSPEELIFIDSHSNDITPSIGGITNGTITYTLPPAYAPKAKLTITPNPVYQGTVQTFDASTSLPGWNGTAYISPTEYQYNFGDGSPIVSTTATSVTHTYTIAGTYPATVTVWAWDNIKYNMSDTSAPVTAIVFVRPVGCAIDLTSQDWRYIDPLTIKTVLIGTGPQEPCDTFRPGDLVQLFATVTYNGAPVSNQLVTFQVFDNKQNNVLTATALSNCNGVAEWDFRVPWPSTEDTIVNNSTQGSFAPYWNTSEFGIWHAVATWQCGSQQSEQPPFEKTQNDTMLWEVSWGLTIVDVTVSPLTAIRGPASCGYGDTVTIKVNVENDYAEAVPGLLTGTIYDNLLVPIYPPAVWSGTFYNCSTTSSEINTETLSGVPIPSYAYVGTAYAWVNLLTTWPSLAGTAFCPPVCVEFSISVHP